MLNDIPNDLIGNNLFQDFITNIVEKMQMQVMNDLKFGELNIDDDIIKAVVYSLFANNVSFEMLRTLNLVMNGADADAFANITKFINDVETIYIDGENRKNEILNE